MKFKIAAAAILNLSFLSILVKWSISGGSRLHYCKISSIYVNQWLSYCCLCKKSKIAAAAILNYNFVMLDHPRSPFEHLKFPFKFRVDRVRTFRDIAIRKLRKFHLKCLFRPPKSCFWRILTPNIIFLSSRPSKPLNSSNSSMSNLGYVQMSLKDPLLSVSLFCHLASIIL